MSLARGVGTWLRDGDTLFTHVSLFFVLIYKADFHPRNSGRFKDVNAEIKTDFSEIFFIVLIDLICGIAVGVLYWISR